MTVGLRWRTLALGSALAVLGTIIPAAGAQAGVVASANSCPGQENVDASEQRQEQAMRCLIAHARSAPTDSHGVLERAAGRKVGDVFDCGFSHTACGRSFDTYAKRYGYASGTPGWRLGENLAWGQGHQGSARQVLIAWLNSPPHRETMLNSTFEHIGIGLKHGRFSGRSQSAVWVLEIGCRGC